MCISKGRSIVAIRFEKQNFKNTQLGLIICSPWMYLNMNINQKISIQMWNQNQKI